MTLHDERKTLSSDMCLLCGGKPNTVGVFIPDHPEAFGGFKGKTRIIRYYLCSKCQSKDNAQDAVEKTILSGVNGGLPYAD